MKPLGAEFQLGRRFQLTILSVPREARRLNRAPM